MNFKATIIRRNHTSGLCGAENVDNMVDIGGGSNSRFVPAVSTKPRSF